MSLVSNVPDLTVIIPVYNRGDIIRYTLESVRRASAGLGIETIIVDDGSTTPAAESIARLGYTPMKNLRQSNQGLLFARLAGLAAASGRYTLFLDSDDLVSPEKFRLQLGAMQEASADVSYTDAARTTLDGNYDSLKVEADGPTQVTSNSAEFFITVQPAPHSPIFRTEYLRSIVAGAFFPPSAQYNPVAEIWFYHNAAPSLARVVKVPGPHTIIGQHPGVRLTNNWEKLGVASLAVMETFARTCPDVPAAACARQLVAEKAFAAWRRLPRGFSAEFAARELALWRRLERASRLDRLGGRGFQWVARLLGPERAGHIFRRWQNGDYDACRTMTDAQVFQLMATLPAV